MAREHSFAMCGSRLSVDPKQFELLDFPGSARFWWRSLLFLLPCLLVHSYDASQRDCGRRQFWNDQFRRLIGGFIGPYAVGRLNDRTGSLSAAFLLIAVCYLMSGTVLALIKVPSPVSSPAANLSAEQDLAPS